jgi:hypothetical protein
MARFREARPFPLDPLLDSTGAASLREFASWAVVGRRQVYRWRHDGLTLAQADALACRFGLHPVEVWPVEYEHDQEAGTPTVDGAPRGVPEALTQDGSNTMKGQAVPHSRPVFPRTLTACRWVDDSPDGSDGFAATSAYVEALWLPVLGPSATWALRRLAAFLAASPSCPVDLAVLGRSIGLGSGTSRHSVIAVALGRLVQFDIARWDGSRLAVRHLLPPVPDGVRRSLPGYLNDLHDRMTHSREAPMAAVA